MDQNSNTNLPSNEITNQLVSPDQARAVAEVQGAIVVAQRCPRNEQKAYTEVLNACKRPSLAQSAMYSFPRGGQQITGPSIRLAEVIARHWGNIQYGIREIESSGSGTKYEAFCWDVQNNVRASRIFSKQHGRWTKKKGFQAVTDPRDQYEVVASDAVRRLRACILEIIPGDIVEEAVAACNQTLAGKSDVPIKDRIRKMVASFSQEGVDEDMLKKFLGHKIETTDETELVSLIKIYRSLKDGMSGRKDWFEVDEDDELIDVQKRFTDAPE